MIVVPVEKGLDWKRPPIVLGLIVLINILVFVFYQSGDGERLSQAVEHYYDSGLLDKEWGAYKAYSRRNPPPFELDKSKPETVWYIVSDPGFDKFMAKHHGNYIKAKDLRIWQSDRDQVERYSSEISSNAYGLDSKNVNFLTVISYQFLHGGIMHLLGNMVFLVLTGFAVEAALGGGRFLAYYLISGVGSALLYALIQAGGGGGHLVGASGSISGVMAMYVVLFGTRKIRFFYWLFIFTGYFRAAAIIMLPIYIVFELYNLFTNEGSNVAYMAHIGGFICGAALISVNNALGKSAVDEHYLDGEDESADPFAQSLQRLYLAIGQCDFNRAWSQLRDLKKSHPAKPELVDIEHQLVRAIYPNKEQKYLLHRIGKSGNSNRVTKAMVSTWRKLTAEQQAQVSFENKSQLLEDALAHDCLDVAEAIISQLEAQTERNMDIAVLARRIEIYCLNHSKPDKSERYRRLAKNLSADAASTGGAIS